jgi:hypothetical protein
MKNVADTHVMYSRKVDSGSVACVNMWLYSSTNFCVHFSTIVAVWSGEGSANIKAEHNIEDKVREWFSSAFAQIVPVILK